MQSLTPVLTSVLQSKLQSAFAGGHGQDGVTCLLHGRLVRAFVQGRLWYVKLSIAEGETLTVW